MKISKSVFFLLFTLFYAVKTSFAQSVSLYDDKVVPTINITMATDSLNILLAAGNEESNHYFPATFSFQIGANKETVTNVGFRLRGNTSRYSAKKSFKVSFNEFTKAGKYQGVKKLNLNGSHNDPTMIREKLFYDIWNKAGNPPRRCNLVKLYINGEYKGVYTNIEEIDTEWLKNVYQENKGNLYKCTYPADLVYINDNQQSYKTILNNPTTRAYDLTTNESLDDYSDLVNLIKNINAPIDNQYVSNLEKVLNVESVLKGFAVEVALGHWDDYAYNKNNYYLYHNQTTQKMEFFTYDADNTIGVDWLNQNWATRNCYNWLPKSSNEKRPLISQLLKIPEYKKFYSEYLNQVTLNITRPDSIFPRVDELHNLIKDAAYLDKYKGLDWGYTNALWENGFTKTVDGHTPYGIKPFFTERYNSTTAQVIVKTIDYQEDSSISLFPNPSQDMLYFDFPKEINISKATIINLEGKILKTFNPSDKEINIKELKSGMYVLQFYTEKSTFAKKFVKI